MNDFKPYVSEEKDMAEFTLKAVLSGALFGIIFGSANAYLGLLVGLTISTSITIAVVSVAWFKMLKPFLGKSTILEYNISQTAGSASSSLASGVIFTIPALFLWGFDPGILQMGMLALLGGVLGILFMIPLRRFLIVKEHGVLPYPEGYATSQILIASEAGGTKAKNVFIGMGIGALSKFLSEFMCFWPKQVAIGLPLMKKAVLGIKTMPMLLGVGYILNFRIAAIMVAGGLISWLGIIPIIAYFGDQLTSPIYPETVMTISEMSASEIWHKYIRFVGAGAVTFAGIITVIRSFPTMYESLKIGIAGLKNSNGTAGIKNKAEDDLSMNYVIFGALVIIIILAVTPQILGIGVSFTVRLIAAISITIFAFAFVTVSSRIVGLIGVSSNPTSGMTIVTLLGTSLAFYAMGWTGDIGKTTALTVGTVVCVAASIAGDTSQDLKCGFLLGATPRKQQTAELIGVLTSAFFIVASVWLLGESFEFGSEDLPAPQATLVKTAIEGVLAADLPWGLVLTGAAFAMVAELLGISSLPFAVGMYLPLNTMTPIFIGGTIRHFVEKSAKGDKKLLDFKRDQGALLGSGFIAGEGVFGILLAAYAYKIKEKPHGFGIGFEGLAGEVAAITFFALICVFLVWMTRKRDGYKD